MHPFTLAVLHGIVEDSRERRALGPDVEISIEIFDDSIDDIPYSRITDRIRDCGSGMVGIVGVMTSMYPRALDIAKKFRQNDIPTVIGGYHVSGNIATFNELRPELQDAVDHGVILYAGPAEVHFDDLIRDIHADRAQPIYNKLGSDLNLRDAPMPLAPVNQVIASLYGAAGVDTSRGCPFKCSFCCVPDVFGHNIESRDPDKIVEFIAHYNKLGIKNFFFTDDNFCRNKQWETIFDKLAVIREREQLDYTLMIEVDTLAYKIPNFLEKGRRAGVTDVFVGLETIDGDTAVAANKKHNRAADYPLMFKRWYEAGYTTIAGIIIGFPGDTREKVMKEVDILMNDYHADYVSNGILTPIPGSRDHKRLIESGARLDPDLNKYDLGHLVFDHPNLSSDQAIEIVDEANSRYYSFRNSWKICRHDSLRPWSPGDGKSSSWILNFALGRRAQRLGTFELGIGRKFDRSQRASNYPPMSPLVFYPRYFTKNLFMSVRVAFFYVIIRSMQALASYLAPERRHPKYR